MPQILCSPSSGLRGFCRLALSASEAPFKPQATRNPDPPRSVGLRLRLSANLLCCVTFRRNLRSQPKCKLWQGGIIVSDSALHMAAIAINLLADIAVRLTARCRIAQTESLLFPDRILPAIEQAEVIRFVGPFVDIERGEIKHFKALLESPRDF